MLSSLLCIFVCCCFLCVLMCVCFDKNSFNFCFGCVCFDLLGVSSIVGILKMSLCGIHRPVFTRGRASIVLTRSSWCNYTTTGTKAAQQVSLPYAFRSPQPTGEVEDHLSIFSGVSIHTRPRLLACE